MSRSLTSLCHHTGVPYRARGPPPRPCVPDLGDTRERSGTVGCYRSRSGFPRPRARSSRTGHLAGLQTVMLRGPLPHPGAESAVRRGIRRGRGARSTETFPLAGPRGPLHPCTPRGSWPRPFAPHGFMWSPSWAPPAPGPLQMCKPLWLLSAELGSATSVSPCRVSWMKRSVRSRYAVSVLRPRLEFHSSFTEGSGG